MYLVISLLVYRAGCGIWLYQFLIIAYLFTLSICIHFVTYMHTLYLCRFVFEDQSSLFDRCILQENLLPINILTPRAYVDSMHTKLCKVKRRIKFFGFPKRSVFAGLRKILAMAVLSKQINSLFVEGRSIWYDQSSMGPSFKQRA